MHLFILLSKDRQKRIVVGESSWEGEKGSLKVFRDALEAAAYGDKHFPNNYQLDTFWGHFKEQRALISRLKQMRGDK